MRSHVVLAVMKRNVASYFSGVLGYLFIVVFVASAAMLAFSDEFFSNNLATLDELNSSYPLLLLFIVPAITMSSWSDERKMGTDELLFTLPASDFEILLGKYLAVLSTYTVALLFSVCQLFVLAWIADPDWGLVAATYLGYWLTGAALLSVGMFASALTSSTTVAFVLGVVICAIPVFIGEVSSGNEFLKSLSIAEQFRSFALGTIPLVSFLYFVSLIVFMLYLNLVLISRRHWSGGEQTNMGLQFFVRAIAVATMLVSFNVMARASGGVLNLQMDLTAERVFSLSPTTRKILDNIPEDAVVTIQAFVSPRVPPEFVTQQKRLNGLLRQYDRIGGSQVQVRFVDVELFSEEAEEAEMYGIRPRGVQSEIGGRLIADEIYMGVVVSSPNDEVVIPFFDVKMPVEYELTRSISTVSKQERLTVGILQTDARITGGFDQGSFRSLPEWQIVAELRKQYVVEVVSPDAPIEKDKYDVLMAVLPSSLTQPQLQNLVEYVESGRPTLIFDDPFPVAVGPSQAPRMPKPRPQNNMFGGGPPPEQKADGGKLTSLLSVLKIAWEYDQVIWDDFNPHPNLEDLVRPELIWISTASGMKTAFSPENPASAGLQELLTFFPGSVMRRKGSDLEFEPLLKTTTQSGYLNWDDFVEPGFFGQIQPRRDPDKRQDDDPHPYAIAAHVYDENEGGINAIFVADIDCISDAMFDIVRNERFDLKLDNVKFVLNAVDFLAGDESYIPLRNRRQKLRTLVEVQSQTESFRRKAREATDEAKEEAEEKLETARENFKKRQDKIDKDESLTAREKEIQKRIAAEDENLRLRVEEKNIQRETDEKVEQLNRDAQRDVLAKEREFKLFAVLASPIPALLMGLFVLITRWFSEQSSVDPRRMIRG